MIERLIKKYVCELTINNVDYFAKENNIYLTGHELSIIYNTIKKDWYTIIFDDYKIILKKIESDIDKEKLKKIEELLLLYKEKYKNYL